MKILFATSEAVPYITEDDRLAAAALAARGANVEPIVWSAPLDPELAPAAVVIRSCWDYHLRERKFARWLEELARRDIPVINPLRLVRWNLHKSYMRDLAERGVPVVPTEHVTRAEPRSLTDIMDAVGWDEVVVKPAVSASAWETRRITRAAAATNDADFERLLMRGDLLVQKYVPEITSAGEWSLLFFGGEYSHAVRKRPREGDFRVQVEHGGSVTAEPAPAHVVAAAERVIAALPCTPVYARIDGVEVNGALLLMEAECVDAVLFFTEHPPAAERFAEAVLDFLGER